VNINSWIKVCHGIAKDKGWWETDRSFPEVCALIHSEVSEALEEWRVLGDREIRGVHDSQGKPIGVPVELADILIRVFDAAGHYGIDLEEALKQKVKFNTTRPHRHGDKHA
jgi:NTP pyrophosphatase (non-canonical NTP hydrolase)